MFEPHCHFNLRKCKRRRSLVQSSAPFSSRSSYLYICKPHPDLVYNCHMRKRCYKKNGKEKIENTTRNKFYSHTVVLGAKGQASGEQIFRSCLQRLWVPIGGGRHSMCSRPNGLIDCFIQPLSGYLLSSGMKKKKEKKIN